MEEEDEVRHEVPKRDLGILAKPNMAMVPTEVVVSVCVVVAQEFALFRVVVLEPVEPAAGVLVVADREQLYAATWDSAVEFNRLVLRHPPTQYVL
ncbi:hypothetical protein [Haloplanus halophilus]|uniref:hypothetical protein n=1 Tax=Haloplanus halophilus TaxID=2949993 RepID=UPI00203C6495|nr:hypothetical protein [Haloplanus sp. GDY1]